MTGSSALDRFLTTDPQDVGCERAMEMLNVYVELLATGRTPSTATPQWRRTYEHAVRAATISTVW